jgi:hypothetical protein
MTVPMTVRSLVKHFSMIRGGSKEAFPRCENASNLLQLSERRVSGVNYYFPSGFLIVAHQTGILRGALRFFER